MDISSIIRCMAVIEEETSSVYALIASKARDGAVALAMSFIGYDSLKHSRVLEEAARLAEGGPADFDQERCGLLLGGFFRDSMEVLRGARRYAEGRDSLGPRELAYLLGELVGHERLVGEELLSGAFAGMLSQVPEVGRGIRRILELIREDEERHIGLLEEILRIAEGGPAET